MLVTHDAQLASWADRVVFLRDGRIVDHSAPSAGPESLLSPRLGTMSSDPSNGGIAARRAVVRWAYRVFRRDWRQHLLILSLLTVAIAAAVGFSCVAFNIAPVPGQAEFGDANHSFRFNDPDPATLQTKLDAGTEWFGEVEAIGHRPVPLPGTVKQIDYRSQQPDGPFGKPLLRLLSGRYPIADDEVAATNSVADDVGTSIGSTIDLDGVSRSVVGIVENPSKLGDDFVLLPPSSLAQSKYVTMLVDAGEGRVNDFRPPGDTGRIVSSRGDIPEDVLAAVLTLVVSTLVLALVALVATSSFMVIAQRRLPQLGMMSAVGATEKHLRLTMLATGAVTGVVAAVIGTVLGVAGWIALGSQREQCGRTSSRRAQHPVVAGARGDAPRGRRLDCGRMVARPHDGAHPHRARVVRPSAGAAGSPPFFTAGDRVPGRRRGMSGGRQQDGLGVGHRLASDRGGHARGDCRSAPRESARHPSARASGDPSSRRCPTRVA